jgi:hypothetical protein
MSLYRELRELLEGNKNALSKAQAILNKRLSVGGKTLMEKVRVCMNAVSELMFLQLEDGRAGESTIDGDKAEMKWVYFKGQIVKVVGKGRGEGG